MASLFGRIIGHERITSYLERVVALSRGAHAYAFIGVEHLGKRAVAEILAAALLEIDTFNGAKLNTHPDFFLLEKGALGKGGKNKKNIGIDEVRDLIHRLSLSSILGKRKVALIDDCETLSLEAANAMLKTLEEPKGDVCIILIVSGAESLPKTVMSRTEKLYFAPVSASKIENNLCFRGMERDMAKEIAKLVFGRPGLALELCSGGGKAAASYKEEILRDLSIISAPTSERFKFVSKLIPDRSGNSRELGLGALDRFEALLRDILALSLGARVDPVHNFASGALKTLSSRFYPLHLAQRIKDISTAREEIDINISPRVSLENFLLKL